ncbi:VOC family protein [Maribellus comscasis]|uniref:VOC family protein n=1 Tax=Maribellus comscasis TaxID=2681766 RepID=A0A6I6K2B6_9BACT|nr:VOC family protein [Maribellus comscasis]QGY46647.1 VOC family protein [Maribellus comscasis]
MKNNAVGWFEIPVNNMERAMSFYERILDLKLQRNMMGPLDMAWFPWTEEGTGSPGSLVKHPEFYVPSADGVLIYLTAHSGDLKNELAKVEPAGGKVIQKKTKISDEYGFMALILDSEGNRVALHSRK